ncbi:unnamed protein product [Ectocarpus sp. 8 AP-2014]
MSGCRMAAAGEAASSASGAADTAKVTLYEEFSRYADRRSVAQEVIFEITSAEHFEDVVSRAAGADEHEGYEDAQGNWRVPHKLMMVQIHAGWCRVCKGLQPKLLKLITKHPEVLCCKINKAHHEELAAKLGVRGLPMLIFYKNGKRVDHHTTANINTIEEAIRDNT